MEPLTDAIYFASKPPEVRALYGMGTIDGEREKLAKDLYMQGFVIDRAIDIWGWSPEKVMQMRYDMGVRVVGNAFQFGAPFITVSIDAADYQPFDPAVPPPAIKPVGRANGDGTFAANVQNLPDGKEVEQDGKTYVFHNIPGPFPMYNFTEKA